MISIIQDIDHCIDTINTHGWAFNSSDSTFTAWRYTATGKETLTIKTKSALPTVTVTLDNTTQLETSTDNPFEALNIAEQYMESNPSSTAPAPAHTTTYHSLSS